MSGGDGNGYNSGAHDTGGNINGGPTGIGGNGGSTSGGSGSGSGWGISNTPYGNIYHYDPDKFGGKKDNDGGNSGSPKNSVDLSKNPESLNNVTMAGFPMSGYMVEGILGLNIVASALMALDKDMLKAIGVFIGRYGPLAGRVLGWASLFMPSQIAPDPPMNIHIKNIDSIDKENPYSYVMLPTDVVTSVPADKIPGNKSVPASVLAQAVIDDIEKSRPVAITPVESTPVPVVKAQKTDEPNVYTAQVVPGMKPMRIKVDDTKPVKPSPVPVKPDSLPEPKQYLPAPKEEKNNSHHAIIDFGGDHAPVYVSVTKEVKPEEAKKQAEKAREEWEKQYPLEAAELNFNDKKAAYEATKKTEFGAVYSDPVKHPLTYKRPYRPVVYGAYDYPLSPESITINLPGNVAYYVKKSWETTHPLPVPVNGLEKQQQQYLIEDYNYLSEQLTRAKNLTEKAKEELTQAERRLETEKAKAEMAERDKVRAERAKVVSEQKQKTESALSRPDVFSLDARTTGDGQLSILGSGIISVPPVAEEAVSKLGGLSRIENMVISEFSGEFLSEGQFRVSAPVDANIALAISVEDIDTGKGYVSKALRGKWTREDHGFTFSIFIDGRVDAQNHVSVIEATQDKETGLYSVVLPSPFGTILINPEKPPVTTIPPLGIPVPDIRVPVHTGSNVDVTDIQGVPGNPVPDEGEFNDFVLTFPDGSGIKPIYIVLSSPHREIKFDDKIKKDMRDRGWTEQDIHETVANGPKGKSVDQRRPVKTEDGLGRNDPATVYGESGKYVVVNDRTGEVTQVSGKNEPGWVDDSRIKWENK
ncbi:colicin-like bacteriocin tRNase domain-containing protein [Morganella morganii]